VAARAFGTQRRRGADGYAGECGGDVDGQQQVEGGRAGWDQPGHLPMACEIEGRFEHHQILDESIHLV
jgi:hypothetical protein